MAKLISQAPIKLSTILSLTFTTETDRPTSMTLINYMKTELKCRWTIDTNGE